MTAIDEIEAFLKRTARAYCDDCLSELLHIHPRQQVNQKTNMLAKNAMFVRYNGECAHRGHMRNKLVIEARSRRVA